ncbi:amylo-alpha-1,6-glucosidase [Candidatus Leptofilum sp.]|uniref:alpha-L-rhamnosidase-related protein n=1 Tax=Candidatus Leptofilum sp. TaxID=3241576 RepID=UPI003B5B91C5
MKTGYIFPTIISADAHEGELLDVQNMVSTSRDYAKIAVYGRQRSPEILFDFGIKTTGYLFLDIKGSSHDSLYIEYGPRQDAMFFSRKIKVTTTKNSLWIDASHLALRYMRLTLLSDAPLPSQSWIEIRKIGVKFSAYPFHYRGQFHASDELLNKIWTMGAYTNQLCVQKADATVAYKQELPETHKSFLKSWSSPYSQYIIMDGPRRDMEAWIGDVRPEALTLYSAFGEYSVAKSTLSFFADLQETSGKLPASNASRQDFKEYNLWWIVSLWECYLYSGDMNFLEHMYLPFRNCLDWILLDLDERGLMFNDRTWMWTIARQGYTAATQCILAHAFQCAANIERAMGNPSFADQLVGKAAKTCRAINDHFWDEERGVYLDEATFISEKAPVFLDTNVLAIVFGIADENRSRCALDYIREHMWTPFGSTTLDIYLQNIKVPLDCHHYDGFPVSRDTFDDEIEGIIYPHNRQIWPFMTAYEVEARFKTGDIDGAFELIRNCWGNMVLQEPGTFWEMVEADTGKFPLKGFVAHSKTDVLNSASHGWSGWITHIMSVYVLGVRPLAPGFSRVSVKPNPGALSFVNGRIPTPKGPIIITIKQSLAGVAVDITAPGGIRLECDVTHLNKLNNTVVLNGKEIAQEALITP